ncbi:CsgE family curli-type amyloid fiber assembly protein [Thermodesulfovibrio hydrogeniphilus]
MKLLIHITIILISLYSICSAQIEGLVIDKTKSKIGRDFYESFYFKLERVPEMESFNIVVEEFFDPQFGNRVSISINGIVLYQNFVTSRYDDIEEKATEASETINQFFLNLKEYQKILEEEGKIR